LKEAFVRLLPSYNIVSVRGNRPAAFAGSPRTISVSKRGPGVFAEPAFICGGGQDCRLRGGRKN